VRARGARPDVVASLLKEAIVDRNDNDALDEARRRYERDRSGFWYTRGVPDFEIPLGTDFKNGRRQLGDFARRKLSEIDFGAGS
jgi:hypothetical protein